jgi:quercetin dioxygenase-like cupin family protein
MSEITLESHGAKTLFPGYEAKLINTEKMSLAYVQVEAGAALPEHNHHNEQVVNVLSGEFELTVGGEAHVLKPGVVYVIPPNVPHSGLARTPCRILDVFSPPREDWL